MRRLLLVALAAVLLPACGGEEEATGTEAAPGERVVVEIVLGDFAIEPSSIAADPGSYTFRVVNEGEAVHALEIEASGGEVETGELGLGESADLAVDLLESGEYEMYCPVGDHRDRGMEGTITIGGGGGGTTTGGTTTEEDSGYGY